YVYSQMIAGADSPSFGEGKNSWLTGTAVWTFVSISQFILGIMPTLNGLQINPCIPCDLRRFQIIRRFRGATYRITVSNPEGMEHGVREITLNGEPVKGTVLPVLDEGSVADVHVLMG
ncbi:MAG: glycosyl transferase, partial [Clostridia bacterium]|nr:glycosyl transferase [Clostridia bacterium]